MQPASDIQTEIYLTQLLAGTVPRVTTKPYELEAQARKFLGEREYAYVAGAAGQQWTMEANRQALNQWKIIPRMLRAPDVRDLSTTLFGKKYVSPILVAPVGVQSLFHRDAEKGVAEVAGQLGIPYILSTAATESIEDVAKASGKGPRWFQLYWPFDDDVTASILSRAENNGYEVLVVTLDTWILGWRPKDLDTGYVPFPLGIGNQVGFSDPVFQRKFKEHSGKTIEEDITSASLFWLKMIQPGKDHAWSDLAKLRALWKGPIVLKGIQHVEDAKLAVEAGVQGIVVSNHGGRQVDGAIGSMEVLPEIVDAVGEKLTVLFDGGVRTGSDVLKALCLGAKGVLVGRPFVYGLAVAGKNGARDVLKYFLGDLHQTMSLAGVGSVQKASRAMVRKVVYSSGA